MEGNDEQSNNNKGSATPFKTFFMRLCVVLLAFLLGYLHYYYVSNLFDRDRNFAYLSETEREMSLRTEMGFYYSYYKTVVEEKPFLAGISRLMYDKLVEYPKDVNAFNRFNIHPEVIIGAAYRYLESYTNFSSNVQCREVDRGPSLSIVESCVGLGHPIYFYLEAIWVMAGLTVAGLFLYGMTLSGSVLGGILSVAQYFANHNECTRVHWTPNERENFAQPLLILQMLLVSMQLRESGNKRNMVQLQITVFILNVLCLLFWQFSQFIFLTQIAIVFLMEQLGIINFKTLCIFMHTHFSGLHTAVLLLQGNDMLKSSVYTSFFLIVSTYCLFFSGLRVSVGDKVDLLVETWLIFLRMGICISGSINLKDIITNYLEIDEDSHIWGLLYSKFSDYKNFHTLIYTCTDVFNFLPWKSVFNTIKTLLLPIVLVNLIQISFYWVFKSLKQCKKQVIEKIEDDGDDSGIENAENLDVNKKDIETKFHQALIRDHVKDGFLCFLKNLKIEPAVFYSVAQMVVFAILAALIMRLKLLFNTQMCIVASLFMNTKYYMVPKKYKVFIPFLWAIVLVPFGQVMYNNIMKELEVLGEFQDVPQEELLEWVKSYTDQTAAFAATMPLSATIMLVTRRPIVTHPHYEHKEARDRAYAVYKTYGKFAPIELYRELTKLKATYLVVESRYCYGHSNNGCSFEDIWDVEYPEYRSRPSLCHSLLTSDIDHFYPVFHNERYTVFKIHDYSVRYMPRSFDT